MITIVQKIDPAVANGAARIQLHNRHLPSTSSYSFLRRIRGTRLGVCTMSEIRTRSLLATR